ncbi:MAG: Lrp/AsnC family transcriptional regulator [Pseudomonadota bacterium]
MTIPARPAPTSRPPRQAVDVLEAIDDIDARLIDRLHGDLPLVERPYAAVAAEFGLTEGEVLARLQRLLETGVLTRFGPLFQIERAGGQFVLAALRAEDADYERVSALVNAQPEVAHNYRREHELNMWFVVAAESPRQAEEACARIEQLTGCRVHRFPKEQEFFVELRLSAQHARSAALAERAVQQARAASAPGARHGAE